MRNFLQKNAQTAARLTLKNPTYRRFTSAFLNLLYKADLGKKDLTTNLLQNPQRKITAQIYSKQRGVLAGLTEIQYWLNTQKVQLTPFKQDGQTLQKNLAVATLTGSAQNILQTERTALNLIQRLSGIATASASLARKIQSQNFAATRKTLVGPLDLKALTLGGGLPYRLGLFDQIFLKENHFALQPQLWAKIPRNQFVTIELDSSQIEIARKLVNYRNLILLLDNFSVARLKKVVPQLRALNSNFILEASGGITPQNAKQFLATGVDFISLGYLTHSAPALDFSLKITEY